MEGESDPDGLILYEIDTQNYALRRIKGTNYQYFYLNADIKPEKAFYNFLRGDVSSWQAWDNLPDDAPKLAIKPKISPISNRQGGTQSVKSDNSNLNTTQNSDKKANQPEPRPEPRFHTIQQGESFDDIAKIHIVDKTEKSWYDGDKGGGMLADWNHKVISEKDGSKVAPDEDLSECAGRKVWLEPPLEYTKRLNEWYKANPKEKPAAEVNLPTFTIEATPIKSKKSWQEIYIDDNPDFNEWKKEYNLPPKTTLKQAQTYWRETLMRQWAEENPDFVIYDLNTSEKDAIDYNSTVWEMYKASPAYKAEQEKAGRHLMNFGHTLGAMMDVAGVGKLMTAPPVRLRSPFLGGKTAKNAEPHKATKRRGKETKLQPKTDPSVKTYSFKSPDPARHKAVKVQQGGLKKEKNTVADNTVDMVADIKAINEGKAVILPNNQFQLPNGRIYGCHKIASGDRMFPISGDGLHTLSNDGYSVLGMLNKLGKEKTLSIISNMDRKPPISQTAINEALHIFDNLIK